VTHERGENGEDGAGGTDGAFAGQVALVTGASGGIGAATARRLVDEGASVVLAARSEESLATVAETCRERGGAALAVPTDVTDHEAVDALVDATTERFGRLDVVVVAAGVGEERDRPLDALPIEQFRRVTRTNVDGAFYTARAALSALRASDGALVFVGSFKGQYPSASTPVYAASKWWLRGFAASVAARVGSEGVGVTVVNPSGVPTGFGGEFRDATNADRLDPDAELDATDVADAIAYAARQDPPATVTELDLYRRDVLGRF
jgi:NADP-dependent 3-hydroxy acid dehydrogenase YdfG